MLSESTAQECLLRHSNCECGTRWTETMLFCSNFVSASHFCVAGENPQHKNKNVFSDEWCKAVSRLENVSIKQSRTIMNEVVLSGIWSFLTQCSKGHWIEEDIGWKRRMTKRLGTEWLECRAVSTSGHFILQEICTTTSQHNKHIWLFWPGNIVVVKNYVLFWTRCALIINY